MMNRKTFFSAFGASAAGLTRAAFSSYPNEKQKVKRTNQKGRQRLSIEELKKWQELPYGMFICFGMSTFTGNELSNGKTASATCNPNKPFPFDIRAYERNLPGNHSSWQNIYGEDHYLPGEFCQPIGKNWFFVEGDKPRSKEELFKEYSFCQSNRINYLLNVPPDKRGLIPKEYIDRLTELTKML